MESETNISASLSDILFLLFVLFFPETHFSAPITKQQQKWRPQQQQQQQQQQQYQQINENEKPAEEPKRAFF